MRTDGTGGIVGCEGICFFDEPLWRDPLPLLPPVEGPAPMKRILLAEDLLLRFDIRRLALEARVLVLRAADTRVVLGVREPQLEGG